jgi:hypothetical protein
MRSRRIAVALALLVAWPLPGLAQSAAGAFWRSLLIPGWGQWYAGRPSSGARFAAAELALWGGYVACQRLEGRRRDNYRAYAAEHARARLEGKDRQFVDDVGFYQSWLEHNQQARFEDGPEAFVYPDGPEFFWEWDQDPSRLQFRDMHNAAESAGRQAVYATGLVIVNHLIAAVHASRSARPGPPGKRPAFSLESGFEPAAGRLRAALVRRF